MKSIEIQNWIDDYSSGSTLKYLVLSTIKELPVLYPKKLLKQDEISNNFLNYKDDAFISILENYGTKTKDIVEDYIENAINQIEIFLMNKSVIKDE